MAEIDSDIPDSKRPFLITLLCTVVFVYSAIFILIFLSVAIFSNWVWYVLNDFFPDAGVEKSFIFWLSISGLTLYTLSFTGALLIWQMKRSGFYLFAFSSCTIAGVPFFFGLGSIVNVIVFSALILAFGSVYRKLK